MSLMDLFSNDWTMSNPYFSPAEYQTAMDVAPYTAGADFSGWTWDGGPSSYPDYAFDVQPVSYEPIGDIRSDAVTQLFDGRYSLGGEPQTTTEGMMAQFGRGIDRGNDFSLGLDGINGAPMRPSTFEINGAGDWEALGYRGPDGTIQTLGGHPIETNPFNINKAITTAGNLARGSGSGGSSGGGRGGAGNFSVSMPRIDAPAAANVPALPVREAQTGALSAGPMPSSEFRPVQFDTTPARPATDDATVMRGLARLFQQQRGAA